MKQLRNFCFAILVLSGLSHSHSANAIELNRTAWEEAREDLNYDEDFKDLEEKEEERKKAKKSNYSYDPVTSTGSAKVLIWIICIAIVVVLIYFLAKSATAGGGLEGAGSNRRIVFDDGELTEESFALAQENIQETDMESMLRLARASGDWNHIIRVQFLMIVQKLADQGAIDWQKSKTNRDYLKEVATNHQRLFGQLITVYEYAWFSGESIPVNQGQWADQQMETFKSQLANS